MHILTQSEYYKIRKRFSSQSPANLVTIEKADGIVKDIYNHTFAIDFVFLYTKHEYSLLNTYSY